MVSPPRKGINASKRIVRLVSRYATGFPNKMVKYKKHPTGCTSENGVGLIRPLTALEYIVREVVFLLTPCLGRSMDISNNNTEEP